MDDGLYAWACGRRRLDGVHIGSVTAAFSGKMEGHGEGSVRRDGAFLLAWPVLSGEEMSATMSS